MASADRPTVDRRELEAALAARAELGPEMEPAVLESFLAKVESGLDARIDARLAARRGRSGAPRRPDWSAFGLAFVSLGVAVPIVEKASLAGEIVAWIAIVAVNLAYNLRR